MTHRKMTGEELHAMEMLINQVGMANFMEGVASIAMRKSEGVEANRADCIATKAWLRTAMYLQNVAKSNFLVAP